MIKQQTQTLPKIILVPQRSQFISNCVRDLLNTDDFTLDLSVKICEFTCDSTESFINSKSKIISASIKKCMSSEETPYTHHERNEVSCIIALYSGGYSWNGSQNDAKLEYKHNDRMCNYTDECPDGICCMSDVCVNTKDYYMEIKIHGKYDQMWLGLTWNKDLATTNYSWDIPGNAKCISYYGGRWQSEDKGHIEYAGNHIHSGLDRYETNDIIGIRVTNYENVIFYKNGQNVLSDDSSIKFAKDEKDKETERKYWVFLMLDQIGDSVTFRRIN